MADPDGAFGDIFDSFVDDLNLDLDASDGEDGNSLTIDTPRAVSTGDGGVAAAGAEGAAGTRMKKRHTVELIDMAAALQSEAIGSGAVSAATVQRARRQSTAVSKTNNEQAERERRERAEILARAAAAQQQSQAAKDTSDDGTTLFGGGDQTGKKKNKKKKKKKKKGKHKHRGSLVSDKAEKDKLRQQKRDELAMRQEQRRAKISQSDLAKSTQQMAVPQPALTVQPPKTSTAPGAGVADGTASSTVGSGSDAASAGTSSLTATTAVVSPTVTPSSTTDTTAMASTVDRSKSSSSPATAAGISLTTNPSANTDPTTTAAPTATIGLSKLPEADNNAILIGDSAHVDSDAVDVDVTYDSDDSMRNVQDSDSDSYDNDAFPTADEIQSKPAQPPLPARAASRSSPQQGMSPIAQLMSTSLAHSPTRGNVDGVGMRGVPFEAARVHIEANSDTFSPWDGLILEDAMSSDPSMQLTGDERRGLRQASEAQQVLARLISITRTRGVSIGKATVMDNYGKMVDARSLQLEIDKGVATYNSIMTRRHGSERDQSRRDFRGRKMKVLVDIVDCPRAQQVNFLFDNCRIRNSKRVEIKVDGLPPMPTGHHLSPSGDGVGGVGKVCERWTYHQMESALLALPVAVGSSVKEHTSCLCDMLRLLERCFRAGGADTSTISIAGRIENGKETKHSPTPLTVTRSELHTLAALADQVEYLETKFSSTYLASLRKLFLKSCQRTAYMHLKDQGGENDADTKTVPFLPKVAGAPVALDEKIASLRRKIVQLERDLQREKEAPAALLVERLSTARATRYDYLSDTSWEEHKVALKKSLDFLTEVLAENESERGHAKMTFVERLHHYDLTKTGWLRKSEFEHAFEQGFGYAFVDVGDTTVPSSSPSRGTGDGSLNGAVFVGTNKDALTDGGSPSRILEEIDTLMPFLDPSGHGHIEYKYLLEYLEASLGVLTESSSARALKLENQNLKRSLTEKQRAEKKARAKWENLPALLCCRWEDLELTNRENSCWTKQLYEDLAVLILPPTMDDAGNKIQSGGEFLDEYALYGVGGTESSAGAVYVPKWSTNWTGEYIMGGSPKRARRKSIDARRRIQWNKLPLLTLTSDGCRGLRRVKAPKEGEEKQVSSGTAVFVGGVTWAHMLGALFHRRQEFLLRPPSRLLSRATARELVRKQRLEKMLIIRRGDDKLGRKSAVKRNKSKKKPAGQRGRRNSEAHEEEGSGVDFVTRMDRKLRATQIKLEQARQLAYKKDRDAARLHASKLSWEQVQNSFFKRLSGESSQRLRREQLQPERVNGLKSGKMKLERRSAVAFAALCKRGREAFAKFDIDGSGWIEVNDLPAVLDMLHHVAPKGLTLVVRDEDLVGSPGAENAENGSGDSGADGEDGSSRGRVLNWLDIVVEELDRNKDGAIAKSDFVDWWVSQCPSCIPLRDCPTETGMSVRRVALETDDATWMYTQCPAALQHLPKESANGVVPLVCSACWDEYRRREFVAGLDARDREMKQRHMQELQQRTSRQEPVNEKWYNKDRNGGNDKIAMLRELAATSSEQAQTLPRRDDFIDLPEGI